MRCHDKRSSSIRCLQSFELRMFGLRFLKMMTTRKCWAYNLRSVSVVYNHFHEMDLLKKIEKEIVRDIYAEIVHYCQKFFNIENVHPIELWHKVLLVSKDKPKLARH